jgi:hypothetical protein
MNTFLISKNFAQFGVRDKDAVLPNYCMKRVRFTFEKEPEGKVMKVDFIVLFVEPDEGIVLIQDQVHVEQQDNLELSHYFSQTASICTFIPPQSVSANDGGSGVYSLLELTEEGLNYNFEFPNNGQSDNLTGKRKHGK